MLRTQSASAVAVLEQLIGNMVLSDHPCQNHWDMTRYNVPMFGLIRSLRLALPGLIVAGVGITLYLLLFNVIDFVAPAAVLREMLRTLVLPYSAPRNSCELPTKGRFSWRT